MLQIQSSTLLHCTTSRGVTHFFEGRTSLRVQSCNALMQRTHHLLHLAQHSTDRETTLNLTAIYWQPCIAVSSNYSPHWTAEGREARTHPAIKMKCAAWHQHSMSHRTHRNICSQIPHSATDIFKCTPKTLSSTQDFTRCQKAGVLHKAFEVFRSFSGSSINTGVQLHLTSKGHQAFTLLQ